MWKCTWRAAPSPCSCPKSRWTATAWRPGPSCPATSSSWTGCILSSSLVEVLLQSEFSEEKCWKAIFWAEWIQTSTWCSLERKLTNMPSHPAACQSRSVQICSLSPQRVCRVALRPVAGNNLKQSAAPLVLFYFYFCFILWCVSLFPLVWWWKNEWIVLFTLAESQREGSCKEERKKRLNQKRKTHTHIHRNKLVGCLVCWIRFKPDCTNIHSAASNRWFNVALTLNALWFLICHVIKRDCNC